MECYKDYILFQIGGQALKVLRNGYETEERSLEKIFQILYEPSFEEAESWEVFKSEDATEMEIFFLVKSVWNKDSDSKKLEIPLLPIKIKHNKVDLSPTIRREKIKLDNHYIVNKLSELERLTVSPLIKEDKLGCDRNIYEFKMKKALDTCTFKWWEEGPENWREFTSFVCKILGEFRNIIKNK